MKPETSLTADEITRIANRGILPTRESKAYRKGFHAGHAAAKEVAQVEAAALRTQLEQAQAAILDIDAHAAPMGKDADGFVTVGYVVSVGSLHRALGTVGHASAKCSSERPCLTCARETALCDALRNQGLLQNTANGVVWHVHDCPASFNFDECNYRCRVAREAFALAGTEPYVSQETRRDTEVYE